MDYNEENKDNQSLDRTDTQATSETEEVQTNRVQVEKQHKMPSPVKKGGSGFLGGFFGGIVAVVIAILLISTNIIPISSGTTGQAPTSSPSSPGGNNTSDVVQTLATDDAKESTDIEGVSKAVVGVINMQQQSAWEDSQEAGSGSGIIYKKENGKAYVVTNHHVVEGAKEVDVVLNVDDKDNDHIKAKVLGSDSLTDLAVLEIDGDKVDTVAKMGSSKDMKVGETALAIGNPLGMDFANTVTKGIISGLNRSISIDTNGDNQPDWVTEVIQTDAAINPGNSGGALVNTKGDVIGINSMKIARQEVEGIGFAIPVDTALPIMNQLEKDGEITRPFIGISTAALSQVPPQYQNEIQLPEDIDGGMVVADVQSGSAAEKAGLKKFDVITKINDEKITSTLELRKYLYSETNIGDKIEVEYYRGGKPQKTSIELQEQ
jgi:serine protease Do